MVLIAHAGLLYAGVCGTQASLLFYSANDMGIVAACLLIALARLAVAKACLPPKG
jgi:hypothetical protein